MMGMCASARRADARCASLALSHLSLSLFSLSSSSDLVEGPPRRARLRRLCFVPAGGGALGVSGRGARLPPACVGGGR